MPPVDSRVRLKQDVERYPFFIAPMGATGLVVRSDEEFFAVRLDIPLLGAEDWDNEIHWGDDDLPHVDSDVETLA